MVCRYKDLRGLWSFDEGRSRFDLGVNHVQGDAYAPPSRCHVSVPLEQAGIPGDLVATRTRRTALADYLTRCFWRAARSAGVDQTAAAAGGGGGGGGGGWSGPKGGDMKIDRPGQHVLERTSVLITASSVEARFTVALPARGRSIMGQRAADILVRHLPGLVETALHWNGAGVDQAAARKQVVSVEDQQHLRGLLAGAGLVAFVADGAVLPRRSGESDEPMAGAAAVPFAAPPTMRRVFSLPGRGEVAGMAIPRGVSLIVGGGFHGKSTLLKALEVGCYDHVPGDGREFVVVDPGAVKIRAEDGRAIHALDISAFINNLPHGKGTARFETPDASGSTSQAANIAEALQAGSRALLLDEDTCATNFMVRDERMAQLLPAAKEPITPFLARVRELWLQLQVSTILVIGGAGCFFDVADHVVMMDAYKALDVTPRAKQIAQAFAERDAGLAAPPLGPDGAPEPEPAAKRACADVADAAGAVARTLGSGPGCGPSRRAPDPRSLVATGERGGKVMVRVRTAVEYGDARLELGAVEQLVEESQTRCVGFAVAWLATQKGFASMASGGSLPSSACVQWGCTRAGRVCLVAPATGRTCHAPNPKGTA